MSDVDLDAVRSEARREALDMVAEMAAALARAMDAFDTLMTSEDYELGVPVEWPLPAALVLERQQLAAFIATVEDLPAEERAKLRQVYGAKLTEKKRSSSFDLYELGSSPVMPETRAAVDGLKATLEDVRRAALFERDLRDALRPLGMVT